MITVLSFIVGFVSDFIWAKAIRSINGRCPFHAANWSTMLYMCGLLSTELVVERKFAAIAAFIIGGYLGMLLGVGRRK
jgi:hypothetical protein